MSHEIMGARFTSRVRPAWHNIGLVFAADEQLSASDAVKRVAGDIMVAKLPLTFKINGQTYTMEDDVAIVRMPTSDSPKPLSFGVASKNWCADTYPQLAQCLDKLSETYKVETAGLLQDGALCFVSLRGPDWDVKGDDMQSYFTAKLSLKPGNGHSVMHTPVRVVCFNTLNAAAASANIHLSVQHGADAKVQIGLAGDLVVRFAEAQAKTKEVCEALADRVVSYEEAETIWNAAFPEPKPSKKMRMVQNMAGSAEGAQIFQKLLHKDALDMLEKEQDTFEALLKRSAELRQTAREMYDAFKPKNLAGTAWAAYNAATEVSDWREGRGAEVATLFGTRAVEKNRAFTQALTLVGMGD